MYVINIIRVMQIKNYTKILLFILFINYDLHAFSFKFYGLGQPKKSHETFCYHYNV